MRVGFYQFSKKENSAKIPPSDSDKVQIINCTLKTNCTIMSPRIEVATGSESEAPTDYNYCWISEFKRGYFVRDWEYELGNIWVAHCEEDVLASWRAEIGNQTLYILRAANAYDLNVVDNMYPAKVTPAIVSTSNSFTEFASYNLIQGTFVVGVVNGSAAASGVTYYAMNWVELGNFRQYMLSNVKEWDSITDFSGDIAKAFIDPFQYIVSCMFFPIFSLESYGVADTVKFGFWETNVTAIRLTNLVYTAAPRHFQRPPRSAGTDRGNWVYIEPFASYQFYCEPWGLIPLDSGKASYQHGIWAQPILDLITGECALRISQGAAENVPEIGNNIGLIEVAKGQLGARVPISQILIQTPEISGLGSALGGAASLVTAALSAAFSGADIGNAVNSALTKTSTSGQASGFLANYMLGAGTASFIATYYTPVDESLEENGRPLCALRKPGQVGGYMIAMDGDVDAPATGEELAKIRAYLEGGFYYE